MQTQVTHQVSSEINAEDGDCSERQGDTQQDEDQERWDLWDVTGQSVGDGLLEIVKDQTTCGNNESDNMMDGQTTTI